MATARALAPGCAILAFVREVGESTLLAVAEVMNSLTSLDPAGRTCARALAI